MPRIDLIQPRGGTAAEWTSVNPVLADQEYGYETDTLKHKYGDGVTAWNDLPYASDGSGIQDLEDVIAQDPIATSKPQFQGNAQVGTTNDGVLEFGNNGAQIRNSTKDLFIEHPQSVIFKIDSLSSYPALFSPTNYNASTNTPPLSNTDTFRKFVIYYVSVAGTQDFGAGNITFEVGDYVINNGSVWTKFIDNNQSGTQNLQEVTDVGATTTNNTSIQGVLTVGDGSDAIINLNDGQNGKLAADGTTFEIVHDIAIQFDAPLVTVNPPTVDESVSTKKYVDDAISNRTETATYSATSTAVTTLDCDTFDSRYQILTVNTDIQWSNTPASGESFVKTLEVIGAFSLSFSTSTKIIGTYVDDGTTVNIITINFANYPTVGLRTTVMINS